MKHPAELKYASTHEWVKQDGEYFITGISDHAQDALGDLVYIEMPTVGRHITQSEQVGVVESVKTASDIHAPLSGTVVEINTELEDDPDFINEDPYIKGWIYKIKPDNLVELENLLSNEEYQNKL